MRDQLAIAGVGLRGGAEARVLAHGPWPGGVHRRVDAPRVGIVAGFTERKIRIEFSQILRAVHGLEWRTRLRLWTHPGIVARRFCALLAHRALWIRRIPTLAEVCDLLAHREADVSHHSRQNEPLPAPRTGRFPSQPSKRPAPVPSNEHRALRQRNS